MNGTSDTNFGPGLTRTRAMLATVLYRAEAMGKNDENLYLAAPPGEPAGREKAVRAATS